MRSRFELSLMGMVTDIVADEFRWSGWKMAVVSAWNDHSTGEIGIHAQCGAQGEGIDEEGFPRRCVGHGKVTIAREVLDDDAFGAVVRQMRQELVVKLIASGCRHYVVKVPGAGELVELGAGL